MRLTLAARIEILNRALIKADGKSPAMAGSETPESRNQELKAKGRRSAEEIETPDLRVQRPRPGRHDRDVFNGDLQQGRIRRSDGRVHRGAERAQILGQEGLSATMRAHLRVAGGEQISVGMRGLNRAPEQHQQQAQQRLQTRLRIPQPSLGTMMDAGLAWLFQGVPGCDVSALEKDALSGGGGWTGELGKPINKLL